MYENSVEYKGKDLWQERAKSSWSEEFAEKVEQACTDTSSLDFPSILQYVFCLARSNMATAIISYATLTVHSYILANAY